MRERGAAGGTADARRRCPGRVVGSDTPHPEVHASRCWLIRLRIAANSFWSLFCRRLRWDSSVPRGDNRGLKGFGTPRWTSRPSGSLGHRAPISRRKRPPYLTGGGRWRRSGMRPEVSPCHVTCGLLNMWLGTCLDLQDGKIDRMSVLGKILRSQSLWSQSPRRRVRAFTTCTTVDTPCEVIRRLTQVEQRPVPSELRTASPALPYKRQGTLLGSEALGPSALPPPGSCRFQPGLGPLLDGVSLELGERPEDVEEMPGIAGIGVRGYRAGIGVRPISRVSGSDRFRIFFG